MKIRRTNSSVLAFGMAVALVTVTGCLHVKSDPIRIEPIYINITINHQIQQELDDIFGELDRQSTATEYVPLSE